MKKLQPNQSVLRLKHFFLHQALYPSLLAWILLLVTFSPTKLVAQPPYFCGNTVDTAFEKSMLLRPLILEPQCSY